MDLWKPFRKPDPPRLVKRIEALELGALDTEDSIEKVLYQQQRLLGKITARQKKEIQQAELALDAPQDTSPPGPAKRSGAPPPRFKGAIAPTSK